MKPRLNRIQSIKYSIEDSHKRKMPFADRYKQINHNIAYTTNEEITEFTVYINCQTDFKLVKNHKAVGIDRLANEYLKALLMFSLVTLNPDNYRGITILSCLGKVFTSLLNARLNAYVENNAILGEDQTGFRQGYSILDNIFTLKSIIDIFLSKKRSLYCGFIDFRKAFDKINRRLMWQKLINLGINGKIIHIILIYIWKPNIA